MGKSLIEKITKRLHQMPNEKLKVVEDFVAYLAERESNEATAELLSIPELLERLKRERLEARRGRTLAWRKVRRNV